MKKLIITGLLLGLSSVAFADHEKPLGHHRDVAPAYKAPGFGQRPTEGFRRPMPAQWTSLSKSKKVRNKQTIAVNSRAAYSKLKLEAASGRTFIDKLVIVFGNGRTQVVELDKSLAMRGMPLFIDLQGQNRRISKVVVYGKSGRRASINVLAA
jgi:hypothetical protein